VAAELITFTANKAGGLIRIPTELEEDTFIPIGQFLARYIARQLAKLEDKTMFLGDARPAMRTSPELVPIVSPIRRICSNSVPVNEADGRDDQ